MKEQSRQLVENMRRGEMGGWSLGARSAIATNDGPAVAGAVAVAAIHESPHQGGARNDGPPSLVQAGPGQARAGRLHSQGQNAGTKPSSYRKHKMRLDVGGTRESSEWRTYCRWCGCHRGDS